jgi:signal transduction histidine kinase
MDEMRASFLDRLSKEKERSRSNQELITVMSHDIRTPLTTLIGYAEIMDKSPDLPEEDRQQYSSIIYQRALRLKELTDEMFYYFLVYGSSDIQVDLAYYNAQVLIPQLINDRLSAFQDLDVDFQIQVIEYPFTVHTDISLLNRVFENIFSNIRKYGDLTFPITIEMRRKEDSFIHIEIRNRIRDENPDVESTHIGTKTCSKLMELLDGYFTFHSDEEFYTAEVLIPISYNSPSDTL